MADLRPSGLRADSLHWTPLDSIGRHNPWRTFVRRGPARTRADSAGLRVDSSGVRPKFRLGGVRLAGGLWAGRVKSYNEILVFLLDNFFSCASGTVSTITYRNAKYILLPYMSQRVRRAACGQYCVVADYEKFRCKTH